LQIILNKLIESLSINILNSCKFRVLKPVSAGDTTSMVLIATEAALLEEWVIKPSLLVVD
jgi:hypothetical protein